MSSYDAGDVRFFQFDTNSLSNNLITCDALGLHYQLSTPTDGIHLNRTVSISRKDPSGQGYVHIADWERKMTGKDQFRWSSGQFQDLNEVFPKSSTFLGSQADLHFVVNGKQYEWKTRLSLKLFCKDQGDSLVASFHRQKLFFGRHKPYIKVAADLEDIFDYIIVSCIIAEKKRREEEVAVSAAT